MSAAIARLKANSGYGRGTERATDIRAVLDALEETEAALKTSLRVEEGWRARAIALEESAPWEYGVAAYGDVSDVIRFFSEELARDHLQPEYGDKIVRRIAVGPWEEVA